MNKSDTDALNAAPMRRIVVTHWRGKLARRWIGRTQGVLDLLRGDS